MPLSPTQALVLTHNGPGYTPFDQTPDEAIYDADMATARRINWGTLTFLPAGRMLLSPDVDHHPLPMTLEQTDSGVVYGQRRVLKVDPVAADD